MTWKGSDRREAEEVKEAWGKEMKQAQTERMAKGGAPAKPGLLERWREWRRVRGHYDSEAKDHACQNLRDFRPSGTAEGGHGTG